MIFLYIAMLCAVVVASVPDLVARKPSCSAPRKIVMSLNNCAATAFCRSYLEIRPTTTTITKTRSRTVVAPTLTTTITRRVLANDVTVTSTSTAVSTSYVYQDTTTSETIYAFTSRKFTTITTTLPYFASACPFATVSPESRKRDAASIEGFQNAEPVVRHADDTRALERRAPCNFPRSDSPSEISAACKCKSVGQRTLTETSKSAVVTTSTPVKTAVKILTTTLTDTTYSTKMESSIVTSTRASTSTIYSITTITYTSTYTTFSAVSTASHFQLQVIPSGTPYDDMFIYDDQKPYGQQGTPDYFPNNMLYLHNTTQGGALYSLGTNKVGNGYQLFNNAAQVCRTCPTCGYPDVNGISCGSSGNSVACNVVDGCLLSCQDLNTMLNTSFTTGEVQGDNTTFAELHPSPPPTGATLLTLNVIPVL